MRFRHCRIRIGAAPAATYRRRMMVMARTLGVSIAIAAAGVAPAAAQERPPVPPPGGFSGFLSDVAHDYVHFLSTENAIVATAGATAAVAVHLADERVVNDLAGPTPAALEPGATY